MPLPVLKTRRALIRLAAGETLTVIPPNRWPGIDIPHFVKKEGHRLELSRTTVCRNLFDKDVSRGRRLSEVMPPPVQA
jgi:tRNA 2-thiouridine synthesizing protein A